MNSGFEHYEDDHAGAASASQHGSQTALTRGLEGRMISTRDYRQNVARDNARVHNGDQHHHYYGKPGDDPITKEMREDPMQLLLESLSFPQRNYRLTTIESAYRQTCEWLFETPEYTRWRDSDLRQAHYGILWLKGKPGAGKSTIIKHALEYANAMYPDERNIHFFFNARGDKLEKCNEGMYRSLLHQLAKDVPSLVQHAHAEAVAEYTSTGWPVDLLRNMFREAALKFASSTQLNCYIDALDEGKDEDQIRDMVAFFEELSETAVLQGFRLSVYFASRHYPHISVGRSEEIILDDYEGHHSDIASYARNKLRCSQPALKEELVTEIINRSSGVFLWVVLVVRILNTESDRGHQHSLRKSLQATPEGLNDLFGGIVGNGDTNGALLPTLLWALFADRSLSPLELYLAVVHCTNLDSSPVIWDHAAVDETSIKNFITSNSRGLLQVVAAFNIAIYSTYATVQDIQKERNLIVEFIHESVREYLLGTGLLWLDPTLAGNLVGISNLRLARWCQSYVELSLQHGMIFDFAKTPQVLLRQLYKVVPFLQYALPKIWYHSEEAASRGLEVLIPFEDYLHRNLPLFMESLGFSAANFDNRQTILHVLALEGYTNLIRTLLKRYDQTTRQTYVNLRAMGGMERNSTALHLAARRGNLHTVRMLLQNGADVNAYDGQGETSLLYAVKSGLAKMMQTVLDYGADANAKDERGRTALHHLAATGNIEALELIMRYGADVTACNNEGRTALMMAAEAPKLATATGLLAHGSDVNAKDETGFTSLHYATFSFGSSHLKNLVLDLLLQHGADTNVYDNDAEPLLNAVVHSYFHGVKDVQLLLRYGADVNAMDNKGKTALHAAVERFDIKIIDTILRHNADVNARTVQEFTPLILAVKRWQAASPEVVEILLRNGADVNAVKRPNTTALSLAVEYGNLKVTKTLLVYGADVYDQKDGKRSIMGIARGKPNKDIVRLLTYFAYVPSRLRFEAARTLEHQDWWKEYLRRNKVR